MKYLVLVAMLSGALIIHAQDTLVLMDGIRIPVKILKITKTEVRYEKWDEHTGIDYGTAVSAILYIKYPRGNVITFNGQYPAEYLRQKPKSVYGTEYDLLMAKRKGWSIAGITLIITGPIAIVAGGEILGNTLGQGYPQWVAGGSVLVGAGTVFTGLGIAGIVLAHHYKVEAIRIKHARAYLTIPQANFMLPTAQNNFQKGFGVNWGLQF